MGRGWQQFRGESSCRNSKDASACWAPSPAVSSPAARRSEEEEEFGAGVLWTRQAAGEGGRA